MWLIVTKIQFRLGMIIGNLKRCNTFLQKWIEHVFIINPFNLKIANDVHLSPYGLIFLLFPTEIGRVYSFSLKMIDINTLSSAFILSPSHLKEYQ